MLFVRIGVLVLGVVVVGSTVGSAVRTVILPRGVGSWLTRNVFRSIGAILRLRIGRRADFAKADPILAYYAPLGLLALIFTWLSAVLAGFVAIFWGAGVDPLSEAFHLSGSSLLTLGFDRPGPLPLTGIAFVEAAIGLILLALLIAYLPSLYSVFSRREQFVGLLEVRAGSPPTAGELLRRVFAIGEAEERLDDLWTRAEVWFAELEETHTSLPMLCFFRSPQPAHSWVTAAGTVLDTASFTASSLDIPSNTNADLSIRAGYIALRRLADFFGLAYDPDPAPSDPISISRAEYDAVWDDLAARGVPLKPDREQAWRDFAGWRVNYDAPLLGMALLIAAPPAPWTSDRSPLGGRRQAMLLRQRF